MDECKPLPFGLSKPVEYLQFGVDQLDQNKARAYTSSLFSST